MTEKEIKLHTGDLQLLKAAQTGEGAITVTPTDLKDIMESLSERMKEIDETFPKLVELCPPKVRLAVTAQVFKAIVDHATEGGSFRYLIYDRLGFGPEAYVPLYTAGGMTISNEFDLSKIKAMTETDYKAALARISQLMDAEPGTPEGEELDALAELVAIYEERQAKNERP